MLLACWIAFATLSFYISRYHVPVPEWVRRRYFPDAFIYRDAPFCCVYVGLNTNDPSLFYRTFWRFADANGIHKPQMHYMTYSGPPLADCKNRHVSGFIDCRDTVDVIHNHDVFNDAPAGEPVTWGDALISDRYWPTNASRMFANGKESVAPLTGEVKFASNDPNYSIQEFRQFSEAMTAAFQSAFTDRTVRVFTYLGENR